MDVEFEGARERRFDRAQMDIAILEQRVAVASREQGASHENRKERGATDAEVFVIETAAERAPIPVAWRSDAEIAEQGESVSSRPHGKRAMLRARSSATYCRQKSSELAAESACSSPNPLAAEYRECTSSTSPGSAS